MEANIARTRYAREVARAYLKEYRVEKPPTPVREIIKNKGLTIAPMHWGKRYPLDGLLVRSKRVIALNVDKPPRRQRFSLAHELGHYALDHDYLKEIGPEVDIDNPPADAHEQKKPLETEANEFANELLVPKELILKFRPVASEESDESDEPALNTPFAGLANRINQPRNLSEKQLAELFDVSKEVLFIALSKHNLI